MGRCRKPRRCRVWGDGLSIKVNEWATVMRGWGDEEGWLMVGKRSLECAGGPRWALNQLSKRQDDTTAPGVPA